MTNNGILVEINKNKMERLYNMLGWSTAGTSLIVNIQSVIGSINLNEVFTILISALSALFIIFKILKERIALKEEKYKLQLKRLEYENLKKVKKLDSKPVSKQVETYRNSPAFCGRTTNSVKEQRGDSGPDCVSGS